MRLRFCFAAGLAVLAHAPAWAAAQALATAEGVLAAEDMYIHLAGLATNAEPGIRLGAVAAHGPGGAGRVPLGRGVERLRLVHFEPQAALAGARRSFAAALAAWPHAVNGLSAAGFFVWGDLVAQARTRAKKAKSKGADSLKAAAATAAPHRSSSSAAGATPAAEPQRRDALDWPHALRYGAVGLPHGVLMGEWYRRLDALLAKLRWGEGTSAAAGVRVLASVALEQFVGCPVVYGLYLIPALALVMPRSPGSPAPTVAAVASLVQQQLGGLLWLNAKVWTAANVVVYSLPLQWRVLFCNALGTLWAVLQAEYVNAA